MGWPEVARGSQKYIAHALVGLWVAWPYLGIKCPGAASWLFVCNAGLMGSWAGYADSRLTLCKQVGDRPRLFATAHLLGVCRGTLGT